MTDFGSVEIDVSLNLTPMKRDAQQAIADVRQAIKTIESRPAVLGFRTDRATAAIKALGGFAGTIARQIEELRPELYVDPAQATRAAKAVEQAYREAALVINNLDPEFVVENARSLRAAQAVEDAFEQTAGMIGGFNPNFLVDVSRAVRDADAVDDAFEQAARAISGYQPEFDTRQQRALDDAEAISDAFEASARMIAGLDPMFNVRVSDGLDNVATLTSRARAAASSIRGLFPKLDVNTSAAEAKVRDLDRTVRRLIGVVAGAQIGQAFTRLTGGIAGFAIQAVGQIENLETGLKGLNQELVGASPATDQFLKDLKSIALQSTISFDTLASSAQKFRATFGAGFDNTGLVQTLGDVNSLLGGSTNTFDRAALALTQISAKGVQLEEINQLREALPGFDALGAIAEARGISVAETFKLIEKRGVTGAEGIEILVKAMEEFPGAAGAMARQAQTLTGSIENLRTVVSFAAASAFGPFGVAVAAAVGILRGASVEGGAIAAVLTNINDVFTDTVNDAMPLLIPAITSLGEAFVILLEGLAPLATRLGPQIAALMPQLAETVPPLTDVFIQLVEATLPLAEIVLPALVVSLEALATVLEMLGPALPVVVTGLIALKVASMAIGLPMGDLTRQLARIPASASLVGPSLSIAAAGVGAFAAATQDGAAQAAGFAAAAGGIAAGFATGGPIGGAVAAAGAFIGLAAGQFANAKKEAEEFAAQASALATILRDELGVAAASLDLSTLFDNAAISKAIFGSIDTGLLNTALNEGIDLEGIIAQFSAIDQDSFSGIREANLLAQELRETLAGQGIDDDRGFFGAGASDAQDLVSALRDIGMQAAAAQAALVAEDISRITTLRASDPEAGRSAAIQFIKDLGGVSAAVRSQPGILESLFGDAISSPEKYAAVLNEIGQTVIDVDGIIARGAGTLEGFGLSGADAAAKVTAETNKAREAMMNLGFSVDQVDLMRGFNKDQIEDVTDAVSDLADEYQKFAGEIVGAILPDLSGTISILRDAFAAAQEGIDLPEGVEAPEFVLTVRAVIDQFEINQTSARGITDQFQALVDASADNLVFDIGALIRTGDTLGAQQLLDELVPGGVINIPLVAEFEAATAENSAARAAFVEEWTSIAQTIAPILGNAIALDLALVLGIPYETAVKLLVKPDDITDVTDNLNPEINANLVSDGSIDNLPFDVAIKAALDAQNALPINLPTEVAIRARLTYASIIARDRDGIAGADGMILEGAGLVKSYLNGGIAMAERYANGGEAHVAQIAQAQVPFRIWAEPETGGEAYIPLSPMKRARSEEILGIVANKFGKELSEIGTLDALRNSPAIQVFQRSGPDPAMLGEMRAMTNRMDSMIGRFVGLASALAQMPPITVVAAGGSPENAASKIFWGQRKRLASAGVLR